MKFGSVPALVPEQEGAFLIWFLPPLYFVANILKF